MRLTSSLTIALLVASLPACGPGGGSETGTASTTVTTDGPGSTGEPTTGSGTTSPGTTSPGTTSAGSTSGSTGEPVTGTDPVTGSTGVPGTTTGPVETTGGPGSSSASSSSGDTDVPPVMACVTDQDCALHNDCCDCFGFLATLDDVTCDIQCDQALCDQLGIKEVTCRFGVCVSENLDCDASKVLCKSKPPECPDGWLPEVNDTCWSGACAPIRNCNAVPECDLCPEGTMCVQKISKQKSWPSCEPIPTDCAGEVDCACAGGFVCTQPFTACNEVGEDQLSCGCPQC